MAKTLYTAQAHVSGGRDAGHGRTSDGALEVDLVPFGQEGGTNPEQLFAVGYAACFESAVRLIGRRKGVEVDEVAVDATVHFVNHPEERAFGLEVELDVHLPGDREAAAEVVRAAHEACPYSRATRGNIPVALRLDGEPL
jgi:lipoyl-dependent peroxiredoxin